MAAGTAVATDASDENVLVINEEFHPMLLAQHVDKRHIERPTFNEVADLFFSQVEAQRLEIKSAQQV